MICSRRLYKGNAYEICLPLTDTGVTLVRFYTKGDVIVEKEPEITGDSMCFSFTEEDLASLEDGVLRYEVVTDYESTDTNAPYVVVTPGDYSGSTLEDIIADAFDSGYTAGQEDCSGGTCEGVFESGVTAGEEAQKAKLENIYIQKDDLTYIPMNMAYAGLFSKEDGYNMVRIYLDVSDLIESGMSAQRDLLVDSAFTKNGLWVRRDGYRQVRVNVPQTGYTQEDLDNAYASGFSAGYDSGMTDCSGSTPTAATAITISVPQNLEPGDTGSTSVSTSPQDAPTNLSYSSSDSTVATVDNNGDITAVGTGTTNICVTDSFSQITECAQLTINNPGPGPQPEPVYSAMPLTFEIISGGTIGWNSQANIEIEYSVDCGSTWSTFNNPISVNAGDMVQFRGTGRTGTDSGDSNYSYFTTSGALFNACGNLYSLLDKTNYSAIDDLTQYGKNTFRGLFRGNTGLTSAENLIMKANTLSEACYYNMFRDCTKLTTSPELPARVLVTGCYWAMFDFCQSLRSIRCYAVENTTSITCLSAWVAGTPSDGTFYKHPNATWNTGSEGIPYGWTVVDVQL